MLYFFSFIPRTITYGLSYGTKTRVAQRFSIPSPTYCLSRSRPIVQRLHSILYSKRRYKELLCIQDISSFPNHQRCVLIHFRLVCHRLTASGVRPSFPYRLLLIIVFALPLPCSTLPQIHSSRYCFVSWVHVVWPTLIFGPPCKPRARPVPLLPL